MCRHAMQRDAAPTLACGIHYGYVVLVVATLGKIMSAPGQSPCIGVVIDCIMGSLALSRSTTSGLYLVATVASAATLPRLGQLVDRIGVRKFVTATALLLGVACWLMAVVPNAALLLLCFYLLRLLGQGAIFLVSVTAINLWWVKRRGLMMGIAGAAVTTGISALVPVLLQHGLAAIGWRQTYFVLGALSAFGMAPLGWAFFREAPERYGMLPDGLRRAPLVEDDGATKATSKQLDEPEWTRAEAIRTPAFWSTSLGSLSIALTGTAFWFHLSTVISDRLGDESIVPLNVTANATSCGASAPPPEIMASVYTVLAFSSVIARIVSGYVIDRIAPRFVLAFSLAQQAVALFLMPRVGTAGAILVVCTIQGSSQAVFSSVGNVVYANFFGRAHLGSIQGVGKALVVLGSALGPFPFGLCRDVSGSFDAAFDASAGLSLFFMVVALRYGVAPTKPAAADAELERPADAETT